MPFNFNYLNGFPLLFQVTKKLAVGIKLLELKLNYKESPMKAIYLEQAAAALKNRKENQYEIQNCTENKSP